MATRAKTFEYHVDVDHSGPMRADGTAAMTPESAWTPEHLMLAGLCKCTLNSLAYTVRRVGGTLSGGASASGTVTRREEDGRFALVEVTVRLVVAIDPPPEDLERVLHYAEKGCFVGASLRATPTYDWTVNGTHIR